MTDDLEAFYRIRLEADRLLQGIGQLELVRTRELLARELPERASVVYDVGGGTGRHAAWLAARGHEVHLIDPVREHVDAASRESLASAQLGDARALPWVAGSADVVLLMGPLYHLKDRTDRLQALREARRVLRPRGLLFAVVIPRWASALVGMHRGWIYDPAYSAMVSNELATGDHVRPATWPSLFMDGYFHSLADIRAEVSDAGFEVERLAAIEGPAWMSQDFEASWQDPDRREQILAIARAAEADEDVLAAGPHVAVVARPR